MSIAFIVSAFPTLSETFILNQITGLIDLGHKVDIFSFYKPKEKKVHPEVIKYRLLDKVHYFGIPKRRFRRLVKAIKIIFRYFVFHPKEIIKCLNFKKYGGKYNALNNLFKIVPFLRKKYDVIHCHFGPNGNEMIFLKDIFPEIKFITTFHGYDITKFLNENSNGVYKRLFKKGDLFMPISNLWAERLKDLGCAGDKILVHRMGVDTKQIVFRERTVSDDNIMVLTVARLVDKKGLRYSITAVAKIIQKYPEVNYYIVGDGYLRKRLEDLINEFGVENKIKLLGAIENSKVRELMQKSHVFLLASVTSSDGDQEGIPVSIMEAMASGLPVISTYHSGIPEIVLDGKSGFLVPEKDVDALTEKLEYLIEHSEIWPEMGKAGRKFVEENFDIRKLNKRLVEIYEELSSGKR